MSSFTIRSFIIPDSRFVAAACRYFNHSSSASQSCAISASAIASPVIPSISQPYPSQAPSSSSPLGAAAQTSTASLTAAPASTHRTRVSCVHHTLTANMTVPPHHPIPELGVVPTPQVKGEWTVQAALEKSFGTDKPIEYSESPVPFMQILERLKTTKREGWRRFGVTFCESISDHMYRMALMAMLLPSSLASRVDVNRCIKMALIHDMAELLVGDITPVDGVPKPEKSRRESTTMDYLTKDLLGHFDGGIAGQQIRDIWQEYEDSETFESQVVHDLDKLELLRQMVDYEKRAGAQLDLSEFAYVHKRIVTEEIQAMAQEVLAEKKQFWESNGYEVVEGVVQNCNVDGSAGSSPRE